jgi:LysR family transcriptional regulator, glycine cleavage system transcriptional activator
MNQTDLMVVCSPRLLSELTLTTPADLVNAPLLHDLKSRFGEPVWEDWLAAAGLEDVDLAAGPQFSNTYLALEAAIAGRGLVLAQQAMVIDALAAGLLVQAFPDQLRSPFSNWILSLPEKADQPKIRKFRAWLLAQARSDGLTPFE